MTLIVLLLIFWPHPCGVGTAWSWTAPRETRFYFKENPCPDATCSATSRSR